jgi:hypothetical protein
MDSPGKATSPINIGCDTRRALSLGRAPGCIAVTQQWPECVGDFCASDETSQNEEYDQNFTKTTVII